MNKNYVTKELKDCLDYLINLEGKDWILKNHAIKKYCTKIGWCAKKYEVLNDLDLDDLAKLLYEGYELEKTKEDILLEAYNLGNCYVENLESFRLGVFMALEAYGIEKDGINK